MNLSFVKSISSLSQNNVKKLFWNRIFVNGLSFSGFTCLKEYFVFYSYTGKESSLSLNKYVTRRDGFEFKKRWHTCFQVTSRKSANYIYARKKWSDHTN